MITREEIVRYLLAQCNPDMVWNMAGDETPEEMKEASDFYAEQLEVLVNSLWNKFGGDL